MRRVHNLSKNIMDADIAFFITNTISLFFLVMADKMNKKCGSID